ncbi:hypothetical protein [Azospirillum sp.]|uniref:hypothetical protein n=1 Tax=Azospirillum sp. TaxID=34012 RepID=UPI002D345575|nr:hypothetical protein [Azospirillum sp.]HYD66921.1 hypothetical protein [Azospirillum sp.]
MSISEVSSGFLPGTTAVKPKESIATPSSQIASGTTGSAPADSVDFSPLAKSLQGDALSLFSTLSAGDRSALGDLVTSGRMSGDDMNSALMSRLKSARKQQFWKTTAEATENLDPTGAPRHQDLQGLRRRQSELRDQQLELVKAGQGDGEQAQAIQSEMDSVSTTLRTRASGRGLWVGTSPSMPLGHPKYLVSEQEKSAGEKLAATGFSSETFDAAVRDMAAKDVDALIKETP